MPEAVIVATARSPIGRAIKGSLVDMRPDDMATQIVKAVLDQVPELPRDQIDDLMMGCGQPAGEQGFNIARVVAVMAGLDDVPGVTVNRYCSSSLQTIRMAAHAIKAGEGDAFIAAGVECVSRYGMGASDTAPNPIFQDAGRAHPAAGARRPAVAGARQQGLPDIYIAMGQTAENVRELRGRHAGGRWTSSPPCRSSGPWSPASRTASSSGRSCRSPCRTAPWSAGTTAPAPAPRSRSWPS